MQRKTLAVMTLVGSMLAAVLAACSSKPEVPLASAFMPMDKAGASTRLDFEVTPAHLKSGRRLMVALEFPRDHPQLNDALQEADMPIVVEVTCMHDGQSKAITTQDYQSIINSTSQPNRASNIANLHLHGWTAETSYVLIAGFYPLEPGHCSAVVRTVQDQPLFSGVVTTIKIASFYNTGK